MKIQVTALVALALAASTNAFAPLATRSSSSAISAAGGLDLPDIEAEVRRRRSFPCLCLFVETISHIFSFSFFVAKLQARPS